MINSASFFQSLLIHLLFLLLLMLIPFQPPVHQKLEYLEVAWIKGVSSTPPAAEPKSIVSPPPASRHPKPQPATAKKTVPVKLPTTRLESPKEIPVTAKKQQPVAVPETKENKAAIPEISDAEEASGASKANALGISGPVAMRGVVSMVRPEYPDWATEQGLEAEVTLRFWVNPKGDVINTKTEKRSGYLELDMIARRALEQWKFDPLDPRLPQHDQWGTVTIKYRLE